MNQAAAFHKLLGLLAGKYEGADWSAADFPAIDRLRRVLIGPAQQVAMADVAILLRQALVFESERRNWAPPAECEVLGPRWQKFDDWSSYGLCAFAVPRGWRVSPQRWRPSWMAVDGTVSVESWASAENVCRHFEAAAVPADPFLAKLKRTAYRSAAQRNAVRAALRAPAGSTLVITLATGEGKSLVPHAVAIAGYGASPSQSCASGVTLVIVPTVALALDQAAAATAAFALPLAYRSGDQVNNRQIAEGIRAGSQSLGEAQDLQEMLGNLIDNACKWANRQVEVSAQSNKITLTITIDDDGPELGVEKREAVIRRGVRADEKVKGSGLGLAIVDDLARLYGGLLNLMDSPLGGLRVVLTLPACQ